MASELQNAHPSLKDQMVASDEKGNQDHGVLQGLSLSWDNCPHVRDRLRRGYCLLVHHCPKLKRDCNSKVAKTMANLRKNAHVLSPVLKIVAHRQLLPPVDDLMVQVEEVFQLHSRNVGRDVIRDQAWAVRDLLQVLKKNKSSIRDCHNSRKNSRTTKDRVLKQTLHVHNAYI